MLHTFSLILTFTSTVISTTSPVTFHSMVTGILELTEGTNKKLRNNNLKLKMINKSFYNYL